MKITFLGQGYNKVTHRSTGKYLIDFLKSKQFSSFTGISAFASAAVVELLSEYLLDSKMEHINLIVGIDQEGTSKDALEEILKLNVNSYIFYQKESPIFHPKIYLFESDIKTVLIVGSSNLTTNGLFSNIESSILIEFNNTDEQGKALIHDLKKHYETLFDFSDSNLFKLTPEVIQAFVDKGIVPEKTNWKTKYRKTIEKETELQDSLEVPTREIVKLPKEFKRIKAHREKVITDVIEETCVDIDSTVDLDPLSLVWTSKELSRRDLNIPNSVNTHSTGSMFFSKGNTPDIDQKHYFRDVVFCNLKWQKDSKQSHLERAKALFHIYTLGQGPYTFKLSLTHNTNTTSKAYLQNNSMTWISWGPAKKYVAKEELLDCIAKLYADPENNAEFTLIIE
ncbi:phospholipase D family protein [Bacteroides fragilis]|nr:phospholipase D family protein [Bacteroides fragilis]